MARFAVIVTFLVLACVLTATVAEKPKIVFVKDSTFGFSGAAAGGTSSGVLEGNKIAKVNETPLPGNADEHLPDVVLLDNVNGGGAVAFGGALSSAVVKQNTFAENKLPSLFGK